MAPMRVMALRVSLTTSLLFSPSCPDGQTLLSPVIICGGAPNLVLKKPVILSFQHCASLQHGHWTLAVYNSGDDVVLPGQSCTWDRVVQLGDETIITPVFTQLDSTHCHLMIETLGRYALIGRSANAGGYAVKSLQVAAFVSPMSVPSVDADLRLRIYCMEDNRSSLQGVLAVERKLQGQLVDQPKTLLFQDGGGGLLLKVDPGQHYRVSPPQRQEIQFPLVWSSPQTALLMSVSLEKIDPCAPDIVIGHILMSQLHPVPVASLPLPLPRSQTLLLELDLQQTSMIYPQPGLAANFNASAGKLSLEPCDKVFRISGIVKKHLCQSLDPPNLQGNDWRLLAQHLGMDRYINYFATKSSPTEAILDLWEARNRDVNAVPEIVAILLSMNRRDAAVSLQQIPSATVQPMVW
ncbi:unnamed protein product [Notodromas monacha]|uniref:Death domain-containing protein n=1 Tax=Notodromas monacha TaxID=399045 RepID=A0A7R9BFG2_9CRUS|nr:unnamed protein product [Notodromas monacha]CAG0913210.1 unnamed protein product [Notodromas monacha]